MKYNPIAWEFKEEFGENNNSFIFSFKDRYNIENHILIRIIKDEM